METDRRTDILIDEELESEQKYIYFLGSHTISTIFNTFYDNSRISSTKNIKMDNQMNLIKKNPFVYVTDWYAISFAYLAFSF